jgi:glycosyltransferase involved in cell wall biosynthesis
MRSDASGSTLSVIICCYTMDRWHDLVEAVHEVERQAGGSAQVLVCVDHNDTLFRRASAALPRATVVENTHQQGLSGARNSAVEQASGDLLVFLDDDAAPTEGWLEALLEPFADADVASDLLIQNRANQFALLDAIAWLAGDASPAATFSARPRTPAPPSPPHPTVRPVTNAVVAVPSVACSTWLA